MLLSSMMQSIKHTFTMASLCIKLIQLSLQTMGKKKLSSSMPQFYSHFNLPAFFFFLFYSKYCVCTQSLQPFPTFFSPMNCSLPGFDVHSILQEWVAMPPPQYFPNPGVKHASPASPTLQVASLPIQPSGKPLQILLVLKDVFCKLRG